MKVLFLIVGPVSFKAVSVLRSFLKQISIQEHSVTVMSEDFSFFYLETEKNVKFISMSAKNFSEALFKNFMENTKIDKTFIVNFDLLLFDDRMTAFKKSFIQYIQTPLLIFNPSSSVIFDKNSAEIENIPKSKLQINNSFAVIKPCPPFLPEDNDSKSKINTLYWKNLEEFAFLNKDEARSTLRKAMKIDPDSKIVLLMLDLEQIFIARNQELLVHYQVLIETVFHYLTALDIECNLLVANMVKLNLEIKEESKVKIFFVGVLKDNDYEQIVRASDLIITESIAAPHLIDGANIKIPVINLKSSLFLEDIKEEDGTSALDVVYNFEELSPFAQAKVEYLIINSPQSIFKYYTFPHKASIEFNESKVFGHYIFTFSELFDEKGTSQLIKDLLLNDDYIKEEIYRIEQYLELRSDAIEAIDLLSNI